MTAQFFDDLCRHASRELRLENTDGMGQEETFEIDGVSLELTHHASNDSLLVLAELGHITADEPAQVYRQLLALQLLTWHQPGIRFGYDEAGDAVVLMLGVPLREDMTGPWLAQALRGMAAQVKQWRATLLAGMFVWDEVSTGLEARGGANGSAPVMA